MWPPPNITPKQLTNHVQIRYIVFSCIYFSGFFVLRPNHNIENNSLKEKFKFRFSERIALTIFIKFCQYIEHSKSKNFTLSDFTGKFPEVKKSILYFASGAILTAEKNSLKRNRDHKLLMMESYIEITPVVLEIYRKKQGNALSDNLPEYYKHDRLVLFLLLCY